MGMLDRLDASKRLWQVEGLSHCPMYFYPYGQKERGTAWLFKLLDPDLPRREYPEASFSVVIALTEGLLGLCPDFSQNLISTLPGLPDSLSFAEMKHIKVFGGEIDLYETADETVLTNRTGREVTWRAGFDGSQAELLVDGLPRKAAEAVSRFVRRYSFVDVAVADGQTVRVSC